jgi:uncharacterized protein DUF7003
MHFDASQILAVFDRCCDEGTFPMLDNGYVYLAATRLSLHRSPADWAMVIEVFGFSPRAGLPDIQIYTFASRLRDRDSPEGYVSREAYDRYLVDNPNNDSRFAYPVEEGSWQDEEHGDFVAARAIEIARRGRARPLPTVDVYARHGIELEEAPRAQVFERCRFLADVARDEVLATPQEQGVSVLPDMSRILQLDEWRHPDIVEDQLPSGSEAFQQLARVLASGDIGLYRPSGPANTHWRNWPEGGRL